MMYRYFLKSFVFVVLALYLAGCATGPSKDEQSAERIATAEEFLRNINFGELALIELRRLMAGKALQQPAMAEVMERAFADLNSADLDQVGARVYARHLTQEQLSQLLSFSEAPTGNRLFQIATVSAIQGIAHEQDWLLNMFDADELTEIMKFGQSDAASALRQKGPQINQELAVEAGELGKDQLKKYLNGH